MLRRMSREGGIGIAVGVVGIGITVLWPTVQWLGWTCVALGAPLLLWSILRQPASATNVNLIRYNKGTKSFHEGFVVANDGEAPAFDVSMPSFSFGPYTAHVGPMSESGLIPRLTRESGEVTLSPVLVQDSPGSNQYGIYDQLLRWEQANGKVREGMPVRCVLRWREDEAHWREKAYLIQRDVVTRVSITPEPRRGWRRFLP